MVQLDMTRWAVKDLSGHLPTNSTIWKSIRSRDLTRNIRDFLWKNIHRAHKCGAYWDNIPGYEQ
jgi:hypothetical protein